MGGKRVEGKTLFAKVLKGGRTPSPVCKKIITAKFILEKVLR